MSSKIKVDTIENVAGSGNVSLGSGHNLVVPGTLAITGASTLTGDLTVDTSTLKVDASNNRVGVGTTSPDGALHVKGMSDHGRLIIEHGGTSGSTNHNFISFHNHGGNTVAEIQSEENATNESALIFKTGGTTTGMTISKDGQVTTPLQPYISLIGNSESEVKSQGSASVYTNFNEGGTGTTRGISWNSSNGRITVPVAGRYLVNVTFYFWCDNVAFHGGHIRINGTTKQEMGVEFDGVEGGRNDLPCNYSKIFTLAANDYIDFYMNADIYGGSNHSTCEVTMIG